MQTASKLVGKTILHYRVLEKIGEGGMGEVYKAEDTELGRQVAVKVLPVGLAQDPEPVRRFKREARAIAALNHPNIVTIHAVEEVNGIHYLIMEFVEGRPLKGLIQDGGLPHDELLSVGVSLAEALVAAHEKGVTHRDLKPSNVMLTSDRRVKVIDFGLAKLVRQSEEDGGPKRRQSLTAEGVTLGTVPYMSPEQIQGKPLDHRTDIFSLGVVLYELATGRRPFVGESLPAIASAILRDPPPPLDSVKADLPPDLEAVIGRCLEKAPESRFQSAAKLRTALRQISAGAAIDDTFKTSDLLADTAAVPSSTLAPRPNSRIIPIVAGVVVVLAAIGGAYLWFGRSGGTDTVVADNGPETPAVVREPFIQRSLPKQITYESRPQEWPALSPDGTKLLYSAEPRGGGTRCLFVRTLATDEVEQITTSDLDDLQGTWTPDGNEIVFIRGQTPGERLKPGDFYAGAMSAHDTDVWKINLQARGEAKLLTNAAYPSISPDGTRLAYCAPVGSSGHRIWVSDINGYNPRPISSDESEAQWHVEPCWSPDGRKIVFRHYEGYPKLHTINVATGAQSPVLADDLSFDWFPLWPSPGDHIYFASYRGSGINIWRVPVNSDGEAAGEAEAVTSGAGHDLQPRFSQDGKRLTYSIQRLNADIYRLPVDPATGMPTGREEPLIDSVREDSRGSWSPDMKFVAFNSDRQDGHMNIWIHNLETGKEKRITSGPGGDYQAHWAPDGKTLVFFSGRSGNGDVWKVDIESGELTQLTTAPRMDINPFVSPDGEFIAFQSDRDGRNFIWVMNADGSNQRKLSLTGTGGHFSPWLPDPAKKAVAYSGRISREGPYYVALRSVLDIDTQKEERISVEQPLQSHHSFSPDGEALMDLRDHVTIYHLPLTGEPAEDVFRFPDASDGIDYPVWSPDGQWVLFDRLQVSGADIWVVEVD